MYVKIPGFLIDAIRGERNEEKRELGNVEGLLKGEAGGCLRVRGKG